jgi:hypothetical protein
MKNAVLRIVVLAGVAAALGGCETSKSSNPLSPTVAGPIEGVVISAPKLLLPSAGQRIPSGDQPITLTVENATTNGERPITYNFEIAADAGFTNKLFNRQGITPGADGRTSLKLTDTLASGRTYYWRAQAVDGANSGAFAVAVNFDVYTPIVIEAPALVSPIDAVTVSTLRPTLVVRNAARSGPAGAIMYQFQVADSQAFASIAASGVAAEQATQTSYTLAQDLVGSKTYFWRARATDPTTTGPWSAAQSFKTSAASTPNPPPNPTPTPGPAAGDQLDMSQATILNSPFDLASWPASTSLQVVDMGPGGISVQFSKKDGGGRWPDVTPPGWDGPLQYTLGMCLFISNRWYCSAVVEFWYGLDRSGGPPQDYAMNWFYDPVRWSPMTGHQPAVGETIGIFVCAGDCRNNPKGTLSPVKERSNVVLVKQPSSGGAVYRF